MTKREFYENIINGETITDEMKEVAQSFITAMDAANQKRKSKPSKTSVENQPLLDKISSEILSSELKTASDVSAVLGISVQKANGYKKFKDSLQISCLLGMFEQYLKNNLFVGRYKSS